MGKLKLFFMKICHEWVLHSRDQHRSGLWNEEVMVGVIATKYAYFDSTMFILINLKMYVHMYEREFN